MDAWHALFALHRQDARDELLDAWADGAPMIEAEEWAAVHKAARQFAVLVESACGAKLDTYQLTAKFLEDVNGKG